MPHLVRKNSALVRKGSSLVQFNRINNGLKFNNLNSNRVSIPLFAGLNFQPASLFTISGMVRYANTGFAQFIINDHYTTNGTTVFGWSLMLTTTGMDFGFWNGTTTNRIYISFTVPELADLGIHHFTLRKKGAGAANIELLIDNKLITAKNVLTNTLSGTIDYTNALIELGNRTRMVSVRDLFLNSYLHNLKIASRDVTDSENEQLYKSDNRKFKKILGANVLAHWEVESRSGTTLVDTSGNSLNGTLVNFVNTSLGANNQWVNNRQVPIQ